MTITSVGLKTLRPEGRNTKAKIEGSPCHAGLTAWGEALLKVRLVLHGLEP